MAASVENATVYDESTDPHSVSHTGPSGSDNQLHIHDSITTGLDWIESATYNSVSATEEFNANLASNRYAVFVLEAPASGANTLDVDLTNARDGGIIAVNVNDAAQSAPFVDTVDSATQGFGTTISHSGIASTSGELILTGSVIQVSSDPTVTYGSGQTQVAEGLTASSSRWMAASEKTSGGTSESASVSWTGSAVAAGVAYTVNPAAAGGGGPTGIATRAHMMRQQMGAAA